MWVLASSRLTKLNEGYAFDPCANPPQETQMEVYNCCNYRCKQCYIWMNKERPDELTFEKKIDLLEQ